MTQQRLAQFGTGFRPPTDQFNQGSDTNSGVLENLETIISTLIGAITVIASIFFIVNFLTAALGWITAGGDSGKIQAARDKMLQSTLGLVLVVAAYGIVGLVGSVVGLDLLNPAVVLEQVAP